LTERALSLSKQKEKKEEDEEALEVFGPDREKERVGKKEISW